jgi:hypothetical protein
MTLTPELQRAVDIADAFDKRGTSQAITGPSPSGKTTMAIEYAEALKAKGVSDTIILRDARKLDDNDPFAAVNLFTEAEDSILIIEKLDDASRITQARLAASIAGAIERESTVVIVTGSGNLQDMLKREHLESRFGTPVALEKLTEEQIAEYRMTPAERAAADAARTEQQKRLSEWREARDINLATTRAVASPPTAVFKPKNPDKA